jgi:hypothetical protein
LRAKIIKADRNAVMSLRRRAHIKHYLKWDREFHRLCRREQRDCLIVR